MVPRPTLECFLSPLYPQCWAIDFCPRGGEVNVMDKMFHVGLGQRLSPRSGHLGSQWWGDQGVWLHQSKCSPWWTNNWQHTLRALCEVTLAHAGHFKRESCVCLALNQTGCFICICLITRRLNLFTTWVHSQVHCIVCAAHGHEHL